MRDRGAAALAAALLLGGCGGAMDGTQLAGSLPLDGRSPRAPAGADIRVMVELQRPSLGERLERERLSPADQRAYVRSLGHEAEATQSALEARGVELRDVVGFERLWNGFAATVSSEDLPQVATLGLSAQPVRRFFPAAAAAGRPGTFPRPAGEPVVALLDARDSPLEAVLRQELPKGASILPVEVAAVERDPERGVEEQVSSTDRVVAGLEKAVDPDGDGDLEDAVPVALLGVNSPYAGFGDTPEAQAAAAALAAGTLVVAPAGNEPPVRGSAYGTVGSPAAAAAVLAVGGLDGGDAPAPPAVELGIATERGRERFTGRLLSGDSEPARHELVSLTGPSQADPRARGRSPGERPLDYFTVDARPRAGRRAVVVPRGRGSLSAAAAAAHDAGAVALVVCAPRGGLSPLAVAGAGKMPVIGLSGEAAERALELTREPGGRLFLSRAKPRRTSGARRPGITSARGLTYGRLRKPDVTAPATALVGRWFVSGTSVAAARVAARAAALGVQDPAATPEQIAKRLVGDRTWPARPQRAELPPARLGEVTLVREGGQVRGVRFSAGSVTRAGRSVAVEPVGRLVLELRSEDGATRRELTPPGGARDLLPGEYAYTLTGSILDELPAGRYRFTIRARGPAGGRQVLRRSDSFEAR